MESSAFSFKNRAIIYVSSEENLTALYVKQIADQMAVLEKYSHIYTKMYRVSDILKDQKQPKCSPAKEYIIYYAVFIKQSTNYIAMNQAYTFQRA